MGQTFFGQKVYGEVDLNESTNDKIMPRWERSFISEKNIFQLFEHCKSSRED